MKKLLLALALLSPLGLQALSHADRELLWAAQTGNVDSLISALYKGANVNAQEDNQLADLYSTSNANIHETDGTTALGYAALYGYTAIATGLIEYHGAEVNTLNSDGRTPLHEAAMYGYTAIVAYLLDHGAYIDAQDDWYITPLQLAAVNGHDDIISLLLNHGADEYRVNDEGWSAADVLSGFDPCDTCCDDVCYNSCDKDCDEDCDCENKTL